MTRTKTDGKNCGNAVSPSIFDTWIAILSARTRSSPSHAFRSSALSLSTLLTSSCCVRRTVCASFASAVASSCSRRPRVFESSVVATFFSPLAGPSSMFEPSAAADTPSTFNSSDCTLSWPVTTYCLRIDARRCFHVRKRETTAACSRSSSTVPPTSTEPTDENAAAATEPPSGSPAPSGSTVTSAAASESGSLITGTAAALGDFFGSGDVKGSAAGAAAGAAAVSPVSLGTSLSST